MHTLKIATCCIQTKLFNIASIPLPPQKSFWVVFHRSTHRTGVSLFSMTVVWKYSHNRDQAVFITFLKGGPMIPATSNTLVWFQMFIFTEPTEESDLL